MEREYAAACRRLSGDWRALERGWAHRRRALRYRQKELTARIQRLTALKDTHQSCIENEEGHAGALRAEIAGKHNELDGFIRSSVRELVAQGYQLDETSSPDDSPSSETSTECLMHLLQQCDPKTATSIKETVERHKKELTDLEEELQSRMASVASHRVKIERLQAELALLGAQDLGLKHALASDLSPGNSKGDSDSPPMEGVKRSKSELVLRRTPREEVLEPLSADEREEYRKKRMSLSLSLDPLASPSTVAEDTFHTATSSPPALPSESTLPTPSTTEQELSKEEPLPTPQFRLGPVPVDSDDMSSTEDYHRPRIVEGQSSSSIERSPEERHQRAKYRRRMAGDGKTGRRQVTEAEALRAMQRLCSRIASQKMLVISSLENDCSKEELNRQIAVLQELQKKYVRLEMALQYSFFDNQNNRRSMMVTPIQETPSLTLSESDMQVATEPENGENGNGLVQDPLISRLKEQEIEASDNVSTSNDELPSEHQEIWDDPLRRRSSSDSST
ncbi:uncharacterized protein LOC113233700, partial [Hyposmocoma kahamanoa]|uniref:uncharacterized protein LOC113233700 n=1 Tax=Hyposmocoma kahamanoa TaxID=1477025 RepID=UPI000E6D71D2